MWGQILSLVPQQWIVLGYEPCHFLVPLLVSSICVMNTMQGLLCEPASCFKVYEAL